MWPKGALGPCGVMAVVRGTLQGATRNCSDPTRREVRPWGGAESSLLWSREVVLEPESRWGKVIGKEERLANGHLHLWAPSESPKPTWRESSQRAVQPWRNVDKALPCLPASDGLPFCAFFLPHSALGIRFNLLSLSHVSCAFCHVLSGSSAWCAVWPILGSSPLWVRGLVLWPRTAPQNTNMKIALTKGVCRVMYFKQPASPWLLIWGNDMPVLSPGCDKCIWDLTDDLRLAALSIEESKSGLLSVSSGAAAHRHVNEMNSTIYLLKVCSDSVPSACFPSASTQSLLLTPLPFGIWAPWLYDRLWDLENYEKLIVSMSFSLNQGLPSIKDVTTDNEMTKKLVSMYKTTEECKTLISLVKLHIGHSSNHHKLTITLSSNFNVLEFLWKLLCLSVSVCLYYFFLSLSLPPALSSPSHYYSVSRFPTHAHTLCLSS